MKDLSIKQKNEQGIKVHLLGLMLERKEPLKALCFLVYDDIRNSEELSEEKLKDISTHIDKALNYIGNNKERVKGVSQRLLELFDKNYVRY